jgi:acetyltransferase-like isoleucine patch superfamily enzyme
MQPAEIMMQRDHEEQHDSGNGPSSRRSSGARLLRRIYRQFHFRTAARDRPLGRLAKLWLSWKYDCFVSSEAAVYYGHKIRLAPDVRIYEGAVLNFRSGYDAHPINLAIGFGTKIMPAARLVPQQGYISIGRNCTIQYGCLLYGVGGLEIGDDCRIAAYTTMTPMNHNFANPDLPIREQGESARGIRVGRDVWIGTNAKILDGVQIGDGAVIGAGSVVTRDIPPYAIAVGVPARVVGSRRGSTSRPVDSREDATGPKP